MENNVKILNPKDLNLKKKLLYIILFVVYPAYVLHSCVVSPIYTITDSDITYHKVIPLIFNVLGVEIDLLVIFLSLAVIIYGLHRLSLRDMRGIITVSLLAPVFKYVLKIIVSPFIDGFFNFNLFIMDLYTLGISGLLEILQILLIIFIAYKPIKKYVEKMNVIKRAAARIENYDLSDMRLLPFKKILDIKNPLQYGAFISGIIVAFIRIVMLMIHDMTTGVFPVDTGTAILFFGSYVLEIIIGALGYLFMLYVFISLGAKDIEEI